MLSHDRATASVHLQGIGRHPAVPAEDLVEGDVMVWNYGSTSTVVSITPKGTKSLAVVESYVSKYPIDGEVKTDTRTFRRDRLVAVRRTKADKP
jgi:hypothetical protein